MKTQTPASLSRIFSLAAAGVLLMLAACGGSSGSTAKSNVPGDPPPPPPPPADSNSVAAWGDSLTSGVGSSAGFSYPEQLAVLLGRTVYNGGVSGQTSDQIAARQGGAPALLTLPGDTLPADVTTVIVQDQSTFPVSPDQPPAPITGTLAGVHGTLDVQRSSPPHLTFTRDSAGSAVSVPPQTAFLPDTFGRETQINVFWLGDNNASDPNRVAADTASSVNFLTTQRFIVLSLLNDRSEPAGSDPYKVKMQINAGFAGSYPDNYLDIRRILVESYDPASPQDVMDHNNDTPPSSLRNDDVHLNDKGYGIVAREIAAFIRAKNW